jgi:thiamine biosynthesis protein ThiC
LETYVILRRGGWRTTADLQDATERTTAVDVRMADDVRRIRSYVLTETDGSVGMLCIYQATSPEAIRMHADRAELPVDEIMAVADTLVARPDPAPVVGA